MKAFIMKNLFPALLCVCLLAACNDIFETDINREELQILAPADSTLFEGNEVSFFWERVAGASFYHLQVATPSFAAARKIVLDTLLTQNSFEHTFVPDWYEWRIRGENSGYVTDYHYARFQVDSSSNIEDYKVVLLKPEARHETRNNELLFSWEPVKLADYYVFQLTGADTSVFEQLTETSLGVHLAVNDGSFLWKVLALNEESGKNAASDERSLRIDNTAPVVPKLLLPANEALFSPQELIEFEWEVVRDTDKDFKEYVFRVFAIGDTDNPILEQKLTATKAGFFGVDDPLVAGDYLWELSTVDRLGNISEAGIRTHSFSVQ